MRIGRMDHRFKIAQASIETTLGLAVVFLLLVASAKIFVWVNKLMVQRQAYFENTRDHIFRWCDPKDPACDAYGQYYKDRVGAYINFYNGTRQGDSQKVSLTFDINPKGKGF